MVARQRKTMKARAPKRSAAIASLIVIAIVAVIAVQRYFARSIQLPAPRRMERAAPVSHANFVGADRCAGCHVAEYAAWKTSTHGRAGGLPGPDLASVCRGLPRGV